jgi:hypothetical protein
VDVVHIYWQTMLLAELHAYAVACQAASPGQENLEDLAAALDAVLTGSRRAASPLRMVFSGSRKRDESRSALSQLGDLMRAARQSGSAARLQHSLAALAAKPPGAARLWQDYQERAVFYNGLLIEVGELTPDVEAQGGSFDARGTEGALLQTGH